MFMAGSSRSDQSGDRLARQEALLAMAEVFRISHDITVERRNDDSWAVASGSMVLNRDGKWVYERLASSRTEDFLATVRFPFEEAMARAHGEAERVRERQDGGD